VLRAAQRTIALSTKSVSSRCPRPTLPETGGRSGQVPDCRTQTIAQPARRSGKCQSRDEVSGGEIGQLAVPDELDRLDTAGRGSLLRLTLG